MTIVYQDPWGVLTSADGSGFYRYHDRNCPCGVLRVAQSDQQLVTLPQRPQAPGQPQAPGGPGMIHFPGGIIPPIPNLVPWAIAQLPQPIPAPMTNQWLAWLMQLIADELLRRGLIPMPTTEQTLDQLFTTIMQEIVQQLPDASKPDGKQQTSTRGMIVDYVLFHIPLLLPTVAPQAPGQAVPQVTTPKQAVKAKKRRWVAASAVALTAFISGFHRVGAEWRPNNGVAPANVGELEARIWAQAGVHSPAWETATFVVLIDGTLAHWNGVGWMLSGPAAVV